MGRTSNARDNLIESAMELISSKSYRSVGVQELCDHAGVKKGSFYHFFSSKTELTVATLDMMWDFAKEKFLTPILSMNCSLDEKMELFLNKIYEVNCHSKESYGCIIGCPFGNLAVEMSTLDQEIRNKIEYVFNEWIGCFEQMIKQAIESGELNENTNVRATAEGIVAYIEGLYLIGKTFNSPELLKKLGCVVKQIAVCNEDIKEAV